MKEHPLLKAAKENDYWMHNIDHVLNMQNRIFTPPPPDYPNKVSSMFGQLHNYLKNNNESHLLVENTLEFLLTYNHIATNLMMKESIINIMPIIRLFLDNILRFYFIYENNIEKIDINNFDKANMKQFNSAKCIEKRFNKILIQEYHFSGAENHYASLFARNQTDENMKIRNKNILNSVKKLLVNSIDIFADISVKLAKRMKNNDNLVLYQQLSLINVLMASKIIDLESNNE